MTNNLKKMEMVINGLKCLTDIAGKHCGLCPYYGGEADISCCKRMAEDAIDILKGHIPRLVTADDFHSSLADANGAIPCWKESKKPTRRCGWTAIVYGKWLADKEVARYWTGIPTDAQRKETPWTSD